MGESVRYKKVRGTFEGWKLGEPVRYKKVRGTFEGWKLGERLRFSRADRTLLLSHFQVVG